MEKKSFPTSISPLTIMIVTLIAVVFISAVKLGWIKCQPNAPESVATQKLEEEINRSSLLWLNETRIQLGFIRNAIEEAEKSASRTPNLKQKIQKAKARHDELAAIHNYWAPIISKTPIAIKFYNH